MSKAIEAAATGRDGKKAPRDTAAVFALAMVLAALAGFVDATGYIHFHHLFVSFMSGNSTQAMVAAAQDDIPKLIVVGRTILLFVVGVAIGETVGEVSTRWGRSAVLLLETVLLGAALASLQLRWGEGWTSAALALAMGVQNAAVHKAEGISVALTYVTGTLVHVGRGIAKALRGEAPWHAVLAVRRAVDRPGLRRLRRRGDRRALAGAGAARRGRRQPRARAVGPGERGDRARRRAGLSPQNLETRPAPPTSSRQPSTRSQFAECCSKPNQP